jgi:hypothetical protein
MKAPVFVVPLLMMVLAGCEVNEVLLPRDNQLARPIIMFDDHVRVALHADAASIVESHIENDLLRFLVSYSGGCAYHDFALYSWSGFSKSKPAQAEVFLSHNAQGDKCDGLIRRVLVFNLVPLKEAYKQAFNDNGPFLLRIHPPGSSEPLQQLLRYDF